MRNVRALFWGVLALLMTITMPVSTAEAPKEFRWTSVGSSPYRCKDCTPKQALAWTGFPSDVQEEFLWRIAHNEFVQGWIHGGERYEGVTFARKGKPAFERNVLLAWDSKKAYATRFYNVKRDEVDYKVHHVEACNNWTWGKGSIPRIVIPPLAPDDEVIAFVCPPPTTASSG